MSQYEPRPGTFSLFVNSKKSSDKAPDYRGDGVLLDGTIMRVPTSVEAKDLPRPVADAAEKAAKDGKLLGTDKNEVRATLKYVAFDKAKVQQYAVEVVKDEKRSRVTLNAEGGNAKVTELKDAKKDAAKPAAKAAEKPNTPGVGP